MKDFYILINEYPITTVLLFIALMFILDAIKDIIHDDKKSNK